MRVESLGGLQRKTMREPGLEWVDFLSAGKEIAAST